MTDRNDWMYAKGGILVGRQLYDEDHNPTSNNPDRNSPAQRVNHRTYLYMCMVGFVYFKNIETEINIWIDKWNEGKTKLKLHEYLGMTLDQYVAWLEKRATVQDIINQRYWEITGNIE